MSPHRRLRKDTVEYLEVKEELSLPLRVLPQGIDVLKVMLGRKSREKELNIKLPLMCPRLTNKFEPKCETSEGCKVNSDPTKWCVVSQIVERYQQAAIPMRSIKKIEDKCHDLYRVYWNEIRKQRNYTGDKAVKKREDFIKNQLQALFAAS